MDNFFLTKKINTTIIIVLFFIYLGFTCVSILGFGNSNFSYINHLGFIEILSIIIFFSSLYLGHKDVKLYVILLVFNILALPSSVDNLFPSILISAPSDYRSVYFPIVTHIDIYLIFGIVKFWSKKSSNNFGFKGFEWKIFFSLLLFLFVSIVVNIIKHNTVYNVGLILSHSYHLRYLLLFVLLFTNTDVIKYRKEIFFGICFSVVFLIFESILYSYIFNYKIRLISGTLGNNVFANVLSAIACYYLYLIIRKWLPIKYLFLVGLIIVCIVLTKTRSALFLMFIYLFCELILHIIFLFKQKNYWKVFSFSFILSLFLFLSFFFLSKSERLFLNNFKIEKINLNNKRLNDILVLEENDFTASLILRLDHFQTSLNMIKDDPIFGIGTGRWNRYKQDYASKERRIMDSHNDFLALASQYGLPTSMLLCFNIFILPFFLFIKKQHKENENEITYLFIINIVMMFAGLTNSGLFKNQIFGFLAFVLMIFIFNSTKNR